MYDGLCVFCRTGLKIKLHGTATYPDVTIPVDKNNIVGVPYSTYVMWNTV